jgi:hypothetical protein
MASSLRHILDDAIDRVEVTPALSSFDRLVLRACVEEWLRQAGSADEFAWVTPDAVGVAVDGSQLADPDDVSPHELADSVHRVGMAWVRTPRNGGSADGRVLELVGVRQREGRPVAWRVRPGAWFRAWMGSVSERRSG